MRHPQSTEPRTRRGLSADLYQAARSGNVSRVRDELATGADPNAVTGPDGETPLHAAIDANKGPAERFELVHLLLQHGASARQPDHDGTGPLFLAMLQDDLAVLELLLRHGADPNAESGFAGKGLVWWARSDYVYETWGRELPEPVDVEIWNDLGALVDFLDDLARRHSRRPPRVLRLLHEHGARLQ
ncbi:MAG: ankyrin repeat domain-containing protein [Halofilum sp. (in: g-proteobacteria)]|nr:ankyrin repeat domain-containing protein [Halofilum sp. (in: g-proteobacteria)]